MVSPVKQCIYKNKERTWKSEGLGFALVPPLLKLCDPGKPVKQSSNFLTCKLRERISSSVLRLNKITRCGIL